MSSQKSILISGNFSRLSNDLCFARAFRNLGLRAVLVSDQEIYDTNFPLKWTGLLRRVAHRLFWRWAARRVSRALLDALGKEHYDIILIIKGWFYHPETIRKIKSLQSQAQLICFNPDNPFNTWHRGVSNNWIRKAISYYDIYFIWGKFLIESLKQAGAKKVVYLPFAYDPEMFYPVKPVSQEQDYYGSDIAFLGAWDEEREWWLKHLVDYDLKIWGNDWQKSDKKLQAKWMHKYVFSEEFSKVCNASKIVLNFIRKQNIPSQNMRTFEVPACGAFVLSTRTKELAEFFTEGREVACFSTPEEMKEQIDFYLAHEALREAVARAGLAKVRPHTVLERAKLILAVCRNQHA